MRSFGFVYLIFLFGCTQSPDYPITGGLNTPEISNKLLKKVNDLIDEYPSDYGLLYQKLYISQQLNWPEDVGAEMKFLVKEVGLDLELYQYATDFYSENENYQELLSFVQMRCRTHPQSTDDLKYKILALNGLERYDEADDLLWTILHESENAEDFKFVAQQYLIFRDTTYAIYAFSKLNKLNGQDETLLNAFVPILLKCGYAERANEILVNQIENIKGFESKVLLAKTLYDIGDQETALSILKDYDRREAYEILAEWYWQDAAWDSSVVYVDKLLLLDSSKSALLLKGQVLEDRGWLNSSLENYQAVLDKEPTDSIALNRVEIVNRKIAYLRRIRERDIPVLNITPKKTIDNE